MLHRRKFRRYDLVHDQDTFWAMDREALCALTKDVVVRSANS